ncbi:MAG TPA: C25 family cysteine peptidase [Gemmataceae bacterium]|nr:C25 family cysteine peptidase [Gemmataceae bacterium]
MILKAACTFLLFPLGLLGVAPPMPGERTVLLGGDLSPEDRVVFTSAVAASGHPGVLLLDSPRASASIRAFLKALQPEQVIPVGSFPDGLDDLERRLEVKMAPVVRWERGPPRELWQMLLPRAESVVICPAEPRGLLLQAACLAGAVRAPLFVTHGSASEADELRRCLAEWKVRRVYAVGPSAVPFPKCPVEHITHLVDEEAVAACYWKHLLTTGPVQTLVVANPADMDGQGGMAALAPWIALQKRAALLLTNTAGDNTEEIVRAALRRRELRRADTLILAADLRAIPMQRRPNPIPTDRDAFIEMEPLTPAGTEPFSFATGRLFHDDPAVVALMLARPRLLPPPGSPRKALVASNPGESLPLMETFSRNTAHELRNAGYQTTTLFGRNLTRDELRRQLPEHDIFLWEGHHNTLIKEWGLPEWDEPLPPSFIFLQSCLALTDWKAQPLLRRGAFAVVGSSTRTYSGSGGACSLAFFDAILYDGQTLGGGLRQAKNFLLAYALLKEKRLGKEAQRTGANLRAAWAFTLWGDPTLRLPAPQPPPDALPAVRTEVRGSTIVITLPDQRQPKVITAKYQTEMWPNARLAGLISKSAREIRPLVFAEVSLPRGGPGQQPRLQSRLPSSRWVFCWDQRRSCGYLLALPRPGDRGELRFRVHWDAAETVEQTGAATEKE